MNTGHATALAAMATEGLPQVTISFIPQELSTDQASLLGVWRRHLRQADPHVVLIAHGAQHLVADCEGLYGTLFAEFPDVLFIAAAGNEGVHEPKGVCPPLLVDTHNNLLSVGATMSNRLVAISNRGTSMVSLAAPLEGNHVWGTNSAPSTKPRSGTSSAAAVAANVALRLAATQPRLSGRQLADLLMSQCDASGVDVGCGGILTWPKQPLPRDARAK